MKLTIKEIAAGLYLKDAPSLTKKAKRQNWPFEAKKVGQGSPTRFYPFESLPEEVQRDYIIGCSEEQFYKVLNGVESKDALVPFIALRDDKKKAEEYKKTELKEIDKTETETLIPQTEKREENKDENKNKCFSPDAKERGIVLKRLEWIKWYLDLMEYRSKGLKEVRRQLNDKKLQGQKPPCVRNMQLWVKAHRNFGVDGLIPKSRFSGRTLTMTSEMVDYAFQILNKNPTITTVKLHNYLKEKCPDTPSLTTIRNFRKREKIKDPALFEYVKNPDGWKNKFQPAFGTLHGNVTGPNQVWEIDATSADVMCNDNKRYQIIALIDVYSRWVEIVIAPTASVLATKMLLFQGIQTLGVPDAIRHDQGKEFVNQDVKFFMDRAGIKSLPARPYSGEQKAFIERFFGTLTRDLFANLPGFVGHNVAMRSEIENRQDFATRHKLEGAEEKLKNTELYKVSLSRKELNEIVQNWAKTYRNKPHRGLKNKTPHQILESSTEPKKQIPSIENLQVLLEAQYTRKVGKKGIEITENKEKQIFTAPDLFGYIGHEVIIKRHPVELTKIIVFEKSTNKFICLAEDKALDKKAALKAKQLAKSQVHGRKLLIDNATPDWRHKENHPQMIHMDKALKGLDEKEEELFSKIKENSSMTHDTNFDLKDKTQEKETTIKIDDPKVQIDPRSDFLKWFIALEEKRETQDLSPEEYEKWFELKETPIIEQYLESK